MRRLFSSIVGPDHRDNIFGNPTGTLLIIQTSKNVSPVVQRFCNDLGLQGLCAASGTGGSQDLGVRLRGNKNSTYPDPLKSSKYGSYNKALSDSRRGCFFR